MTLEISSLMPYLNHLVAAHQGPPPALGRSKRSIMRAAAVGFLFGIQLSPVSGFNPGYIPARPGSSSFERGQRCWSRNPVLRGDVVPTKQVDGRIRGDMRHITPMTTGCEVGRIPCATSFWGKNSAMVLTSGGRATTRLGRMVAGGVDGGYRLHATGGPDGMRAAATGVRPVIDPTAAAHDYLQISLSMSQEVSARGGSLVSGRESR